MNVQVQHCEVTPEGWSYCDKSCKTVIAHLIGAILVKCRKLGPFGVYGGPVLQNCRGTCFAKIKRKKLLPKIKQKKKKIK